MPKKNVSMLVSANGWIAGLVEKLINALRKRGITDEEIHALVNEKGNVLFDKIVDAIAEFASQVKKNIYTIFVDYTKSVEKMVKLGKYDWSNDDITAEHFPTKRVGEADLKIELIHFDRSISSEDALKEMDKMGYRPVELHELLAFGAKHPDVQREFPIIELGSVWSDPGGDRNVVFLDGGGSKRGLYLDDFDDGWDGYCRFAAVRK